MSESTFYTLENALPKRLPDPVRLKSESIDTQVITQCQSFSALNLFPFLVLVICRHQFPLIVGQAPQAFCQTIETFITGHIGTAVIGPSSQI